MAIITQSLSTANNIACSLLTNTLAGTGTAQSVIWQSLPISNASNAMDALVQCYFPTFATAPANDKAMYIYAYGGSGTSYTTPCVNSESIISITTATGWDIKPIGVVGYPASGETIISSPMNVASAFGGIMPTKWGVVVNNFSGTSISANAWIVYQELTATST